MSLLADESRHFFVFLRCGGQEKRKKGKKPGFLSFFALSKADSNHHKQNQNLLCYHYTIGQSLVSGCKISKNSAHGQIFPDYFTVSR